jgi:membrane-associated phospholipid phosphatase
VRRSVSVSAVAGTLLASGVLTFGAAAGAQKLGPPPHPGTAPTERGRLRFVADPITDGAIISISFGFAALLDTIIGAEELRPQQPGPTSNLIGIDRAVVDDEPSPGWRRVSNIGVGAAGVYAAADIVFTTFDEGTEAGLVDLIIYSESATITWAVTNLAKIAVRRPRPFAYRARDELLAQGVAEQDLPEITDTNAALSFFSGHSSMAAALSTTATYLAFARSRDPTRGFVTAGIGGLVTTAVCVGRVKGGVHFPTDVVAGAMAGIGIGALVPHFHREGESKPVWVGVGPQGGDGVGLSVNGLF